MAVRFGQFQFGTDGFGLNGEQAILTNDISSVSAVESVTLALAGGTLQVNDMVSAVELESVVIEQYLLMTIDQLLAPTVLEGVTIRYASDILTMSGNPPNLLRLDGTLAVIYDLAGNRKY